MEQREKKTSKKHDYLMSLADVYKSSICDCVKDGIFHFFITEILGFLSKGANFVLTHHGIDKAKFKQKLGDFRRKLSLIWHFRNDVRTHHCSKDLMAKFRI